MKNTSNQPTSKASASADQKQDHKPNTSLTQSENVTPKPAQSAINEIKPNVSEPLVQVETKNTKQNTQKSNAENSTTKATMSQNNKTAPSSSGSTKLIAALALVLAGGSVTGSVFMWQRMAQMQQHLEATSGNSSQITDLINNARNLAQQSLDISKDLQGKIAYLTNQINTMSEDSKRIDTLMQLANNSNKTDFLPATLRSVISSAELQTQLTGSVQPLMTTLKAIDASLEENGYPSQSQLRSAIALDIENIRNFPAPEPMRISTQIADLLDIMNKPSSTLPLLIDKPENMHNFSVDVNLSDNPISTPAPSANTSTWGSVQQAWDWTTDKASEIGSSVWAEVHSLVRITPIDNKDALLLSGTDGMLLRENIKMRLMGLRIAVLQRQYAQAQKELLAIEHMFSTYFDPSNPNVKDALRRIRAIQSDLQNVALPTPSATLAALNTLSSQP